MPSEVGSIMTPHDFLNQVVRPNVHDALTRPDNFQAISNAILTMDALVGIMAWHLRDNGDPSLANLPDDKVDAKYRDELADASPAYKALSDASASLKHGRLTRPKAPPRVMTDPKQMTEDRNTIGYMQTGVDPLGGNLVFLDLTTGRRAARDIIHDAFNALSQRVSKLPP